MPHELASAMPLAGGVNQSLHPQLVCTPGDTTHEIYRQLCGKSTRVMASLDRVTNRGNPVPELYTT